MSVISCLVLTEEVIDKEKMSGKMVHVDVSVLCQQISHLCFI